MSEQIYQEIWQNDPGRLSVSGRAGDGWTDGAADILLDEQVRADGRREIDLATRPLFHSVRAARLERGTFPAFETLLDNYAVNTRDPEVTAPEEEREIDAFVDLVVDSEPMRIAYDHIATSLARGLSPDAFRAQLRAIWFELYTNHFNGRSTHFASGFEHVFVGEGKFDRRHGAAETKGEISGYHSWLKFYRDEVAGRVNYLGFKYDLSGAGVGPDNPQVVTLQMVQNHMDLGGQLRAQLFKKKGGFFVGTSPECEIALGTLAFFESLAGLLNDQRKRVRLGDGLFDLVMYRSTLEGGGRGPHIRSFYPVYLGGGLDGGGDGVIVRPVDPEASNAGPVVINRALPNPPGDDRAGEWIELRNVAEAPVELAGWELRDKMSRPLAVGGSLASGDAARFEVPRADDLALHLGNRSGIITLHDASGALIAAVSYGRAREGEVITFGPH